MFPRSTFCVTICIIMTVCTYMVWGDFLGDLREPVIGAVERGWTKSNSWDDLQKCIADQLRHQFGSSAAFEDVPMSELGVQGSRAQIDIVLGGLADEELGGFLIHVSGHKLPRHEKELLEIMAVSLVDQRFKYGVLIVCSDNRLRLEGKARSYAYCSGPLLRLAEPVIQRCSLLGLLIVGLPSRS